MQRHPPLTLEQINSRLVVDLEAGRCLWRDATKHHRRLNGQEAGCPRKCSNGHGAYWVIKINRVPYKRAQIVLMVASGIWPSDVVDHKNGDKLDDRAGNLRHATVMHNNWNHKRRAKKASTPMGVRMTESGRFQARIRCNNKLISIGTFSTEEAAASAYQSKRKELFHAYS